MGMVALENAVLRELKEVAKNNRLRKKDILEWRTGKQVTVGAGEKKYWLPELQITAVIKDPNA